MVGEEIFSEPQGPENRQNRSQPRQRPSSRIRRVTRHQPMSHVGERLAEKRKSRLGVVQSAGPATKCGSIGHAVGVLERRRCLLPRTMLHQAPPQCLTARQQTVMGVRERKQREEGEGLPATTSATAPNPNPVVVCIVRLLAATRTSHTCAARRFCRRRGRHGVRARPSPAGSVVCPVVFCGCGTQRSA